MAASLRSTCGSALRTARQMSNLYIQLAELPVPISARFVSPNAVTITSSVRDHVRNTKRSILQTFYLTPNLVKSLVQDVGDVVLSAVSPSSARVANLKEIVEKGTAAKKRYVEVWHGSKLEVSHDVTDLHGAFYADDYLASLSFSPSEDKLLYTAEANPPKDNSDNNYDRHAQFRFRPHLGEGLTGKKRPTVYEFRWEHGASSTLDQSDTVSVNAWPEPQSSPTPTLFGQAVSGEEIDIATGYRYTSDGILLGPKGCYNRPTALWIFRNDDFRPVPLIPEDGRGRRSPRIYTHGTRDTVFYLSNEQGGAHASCTALHVWDEESGEKTLVDTVWEPRADGFPGLYPDFNLPTHPFLNLGAPDSPALHLITHSIWGSRSTLLLISAEDGSIINLTPDPQDSYSWTVLCTNKSDMVVCSRSSPSVPPEIVLGRFDKDKTVKWEVINKPVLSAEVADDLTKLQTSVISIPDHHPTETIVIRTFSTSPGSEIPPCITMPHGGPHGTTTTAFSAATAALALQGYTISMPNYTGSLGYGETSVRKLLGQCGTLDVQDCISSVHHLIKLGIAEAGPGKQFIQGGSHGGFLTAHLIGQYPDIFTAAVLRNPVISCGEISTSDIPDWYYAEFGLPFGPTTTMTPDIYATLYAASPISHVDRVRARVLLLVGEADQRVAPTQAKTYFHALKGRGKEVEMFCFPGEGHPLDGVEASRAGWEQALDWFKIDK